MLGAWFPMLRRLVSRSSSRVISPCGIAIALPRLPGLLTDGA